MAQSFEIDPVRELAVATVGEPGNRRFFLVASGVDQRATLGCEKFHVQGLVLRVQQILETQGLGSAFDPMPGRRMPQVGDPDWQVGELGIGYHAARGRFVIVARQLVEGERAEPGGDDDDAETLEAASGSGTGAIARVWVDPDRVRAFARQAEAILSAGRPLCTYCGLPIDPAGHPCPASNGSRPIF